MKKVREGYKMTDLGEIPDSWKVEMIDNLFDFYGGISISRDKQVDNGVFYLHYGDIHKKNKNYFSVEEDCNWLPKVEIDTNDLKEGVLLNTGDVVFADASEDYEGIGKSVVIFNENNEPFVSGLHTIVAKDKVKELDTLYKKYCFSTTEVRKQFRELATGATVYGISRSNIKNIKILVPTIKEQEHISLTLSSVDEQIEIIDNLIEKTKKLKKGLMQKLLTEGIGHSRFKDTEIGRIPVEWEVKKLGDICDVRKEKFNPVERENDKYIALEHIEQGTGRINGVGNSDETTSMKTKFNKGDILFGKLRPYLRKFWFAGFDGVCATEILPLFMKYNDNSKFCFYVVQQDKFIEYTNQSSFGTKMPRTSWNDMKEFIFPLPSIVEQDQIALILTSVDEQMSQYELKKEKLKELKKGLMQKLLTGKIRVK